MRIHWHFFCLHYHRFVLTAQLEYCPSAFCNYPTRGKGTNVLNFLTGRWVGESNVLRALPFSLASPCNCKSCFMLGHYDAVIFRFFPTSDHCTLESCARRKLRNSGRIPTCIFSSSSYFFCSLLLSFYCDGRYMLCSLMLKIGKRRKKKS